MCFYAFREGKTQQDMALPREMTRQPEENWSPVIYGTVFTVSGGDTHAQPSPPEKQRLWKRPVPTVRTEQPPDSSGRKSKCQLCVTTATQNEGMLLFPSIAEFAKILSFLNFALSEKERKLAPNEVFPQTAPLPNKKKKTEPGKQYAKGK